MSNFYIITPGGAGGSLGPWPTFASLISNKTLAAGDIVEFQATIVGGVFDCKEPSQMSPNGNGTLGNVITIRGRSTDIVYIDGNYSQGGQTVNTCFNINGRSFITVQNLVFMNATGLASAGAMVVTLNSSNISFIGCTIFVGFGDNQTAATITERCGMIQSGANFTMSFCSIWVGPGEWGSGQTDCIDLGCNGGTINNCNFNMLNAAVSSAGGLDTSTVVAVPGTGYAANDTYLVNGGLYGTIKVTGVSSGGITSYTVLTQGVRYTSGVSYTLTPIIGSGINGQITVSNSSASSAHNDCFQVTNASNVFVDSCVMNRNVTNATTATSGQAVIVEWYNLANDSAPSNYGTFSMTNCVAYGNYGSNGITMNSRHSGGNFQCGIANINFCNNTVDCFAYISGSSQSIPMAISFDPTIQSNVLGVWTGGTLNLQNNIIINRNSNITLGGGIIVSAPYGSLSQAAAPNGSNYVTGSHTTSGGHGTGCVVNVTAIDGGVGVATLTAGGTGFTSADVGTSLSILPSGSDLTATGGSVIIRTVVGGAVTTLTQVPNYPNIDYPGTPGTVLGAFTSNNNHLYYTGNATGATSVNTVPSTNSRTSSITSVSWSTWVGTYGYDVNGIGYNTPGFSSGWTDPMHVAPGSANYVLQSGSPDRGKGLINGSTPTNDMNGRLRPYNNPNAPQVCSIGASEAWTCALSAFGGNIAPVFVGP